MTWISQAGSPRRWQRGSSMRAVSPGTFAQPAAAVEDMTKDVADSVAKTIPDVVRAAIVGLKGP